MMREMRSMSGRFGWAAGLALLVVVLYGQRDAGAHVLSNPQSNWCSPHNNNSSTGGSVFTGCYRIGTTSVFGRDFYCGPNTACALDLCGWYWPAWEVDGGSRSDGSTAHTGSGKHRPTITYYECY